MSQVLESPLSWISRKTSMMHQSRRGYAGKVGHHKSAIEEYSLCDTSIPEFNAVFPLFPFSKWKHGIPLFPKVSHSVGKVSRHTDLLSDRVLGALLDAGIIFISPKNSAFVSSFFLAYLSIKLSKEINDITNMIEQ